MTSRNWLLPEPHEEEDLRAFWRSYREGLTAVREEMLTRAKQHPRLAMMAELSVDPEESQRAEQLQRDALEHSRWIPYLDNLYERGRRYAQSGLRLEQWYELLHLFRTSLLQRLVDMHANDAAGLAAAVAGMERFVDLSMGAITASYIAEKERIISDQAAAIKELATPILRLRDRLLVVPVVGVVDTHRARELTESLLHAVRRHRARAVVLDITGVPIVDSKVANHLVQTVEAVRLMGAQVIVSGISPEIARTLVAIGANMSSVMTVGEFDVAVEVAGDLVDEPHARPPVPAGAANGEI